MKRKKPALKSKSGRGKESRLWQPTNRQVLWAIGTVAVLVTIALLVVNLYPGIWKDLSRERLERVATLIGIAVALIGLIVLLAIGGASLGWTGFSNKTIWDWLELLIVPVALAAIGFVFTMQQEARQQSIENQRAQAERQLAKERAQDDALQTYFDQMANLMLDRGLRESEEGDEERLLARARTVTILRSLDSERSSDVVRFLREAQLIGGEEPVVRLDHSNLSGADLAATNQINLGLGAADLAGLDLEGSDLSQADLSGADLSGADLSDANLFDTDLRGANLRTVDLKDATIYGANLTDANLFSADLTDANLRKVELSGANLSKAKGVSNEELEEQASSLAGALMPDGQIYPGGGSDVTLFVPSITGQTLEEAQQTVSGDFGVVVDEGSISPDDIIISQDPGAGEQAKQGSTIHVKLGPGDVPFVTVPDIRGMSVPEGIETLEASGLMLGNAQEVSSGTVPRGQIISQSPPSGSLELPDSPINVTISNGPL